jgi:hypothetical protein
MASHGNALPTSWPGLSRAASLVLPLCFQMQGRRDKPGDDACFNTIQSALRHDLNAGAMAENTINPAV